MLPFSLRIQGTFHFNMISNFRINNIKQHYCFLRIFSFLNCFTKWGVLRQLGKALLYSVADDKILFPALSMILNSLVKSVSPAWAMNLLKLCTDFVDISREMVHSIY